MTEENGGSAIPAGGYGDLLESTALAHGATIGPGGEPQSDPVWFDWDGEHVEFSHTKTRQKKLRNPERDPRIALSIADPQDPYRYLEIRGEVEWVEEDLNIDFIGAMAKEYLGVERYPGHSPGDERVIVFVRPEHTTRMDG